jgi:glutamate/tyrosine decarboxylase-like PLP-dependent enzyme
MSKTVFVCSSQKGMFFLGFGTDALVMVECDEEGRMSPPRLEEAILSAKQRGATPVMVNATSGTTVMGAYDPLGTIADICRKHDVLERV